MAAAATADLRLPGYFPRIKGCERVGGAFMTCFATKAVKSGEEDAEAGKRGLQACARELSAYEACMNKDGKKEAKRYRVQDEYRVRVVPPEKSS